MGRRARVILGTAYMLLMTTPALGQQKCEWLIDMRVENRDAAQWHVLGLVGGFYVGGAFARDVVEDHWSAAEASKLAGHIDELVPSARFGEFTEETLAVCDEDPQLTVEDAFLEGTRRVRERYMSGEEDVREFAHPSSLEALLGSVWFGGLAGFGFGLLGATAFWRRRVNGPAS